MKKMIYILGLSLGMGFSQSASAFCCCATQRKTQPQIQMPNGVERITYPNDPSGKVTYRLTDPKTNITHQVSGYWSNNYHCLMYTGVTYKGVPSTILETYTPQKAQVLYRNLRETFEKMG